MIKIEGDIHKIPVGHKYASVSKKTGDRHIEVQCGWVSAPTNEALSAQVAVLLDKGYYVSNKIEEKK